MEKTVVGIGEMLWDMLPAGKRLGGAPANFAYHVAQQGVKACAVSAVGCDSLGDEIAAAMAGMPFKVEVEHVDFPTGTVNVELDAAGVPEYDIARNVAWDNIPFTPALAELARHTSAVCFGSLAQRSPVSRQTIRRFIEEAERHGEVLKIFDVNLRQDYYSRDVIEDSLRLCDILKINDEELPLVASLTGCRAADAAGECRRLMERFGLRMVILTCGTAGSYVFTDTEKMFQPTPMVEVADTVGAGDSFTGAFIARLMRGDSVEQAHAAAVSVSAYVCSQHGAMPAMPEELRLSNRL